MNRVTRPPGILASLLCRAASALALAALGCAAPHSGAVRWPAQGEGIPAQPVSASSVAGVTLRADAIEWEPQAVVVELVITNTGEGLLEVEREAITLAWDELEYAVEPPDRDGPRQPAKLAIESGEEAGYHLRYQLGRPLMGPGARLILRATSRAGEAIVDLPELELPPLSVR
jgi:hypothetical protein